MNRTRLNDRSTSLQWLSILFVSKSLISSHLFLTKPFFSRSLPSKSNKSKPLVAFTIPSRAFTKRVILKIPEFHIKNASEDLPKKWSKNRPKPQDVGAKIQEVKLRCQQLDVFASKTRRILKLLAAEENCPDLSSRLTAISTQDEITSVMLDCQERGTKKKKKKNFKIQ